MIRDACRKIGEFYLKEFNYDYDKTRSHILNLMITKVNFENDKLAITTARAGLLIGKRGENIEKLSEYLGISIKVIEDMEGLTDSLIPYEDQENDYA